jgi:HEAT repeat protein
MRITTNFTRSILVALAITATLPPSSAQAGRGSSYSQVMSAIQTGNADVITFELERAERLVCGACIEPVMHLLDSDDARIREVAAWWFARRPAQKAEIHDLAVARLYADDPTLARNAADALGTFRHPDALPALTYAASRTDLAPEARAHAVAAIGTIGHPAGRPAVEAAMKDVDPTVRLAAVRAYDSLRGDRDAAPVVALVGDADVTVRREAIAAVGRYRQPAARAALETILTTDSDEMARRNAAWALGMIGDEASRSVLTTAAKNDASSLVRSVATAAITKLR